MPPTALSAFINDTLFLDSDTATQLIDSAYVQLRQDFAYASLTGVPASSAGVDSAAVIELIDSDYVQLRQDYAYGSLTDAPNVLDSADVALIAGDAGVDSATVLGLIDSAHVQLRQDYAYASLTGTPNVLDSADVSLIAGGLSGVDSATVLGLIDSAHVQLRQDYAYGSLTGTPNVLDSADVALIAGDAGVDSATVLGLIDSAHVQLRQDYAYGSLTDAPNVLDSADVSSIAGGLSGVDSAYVATQINALIDGAPGALDTLNEIAIALNNDSDAYNTLLSKIDSNGTALSSKLDTNQSLSLITTTVDSAYVQLRQSSVGPATFADLTEISLADLDVHDIAVPATSVHVITPNGSSAYRSDIHGTTDNPTLYVSAGETIAFDLTGVTGSHPFEIRSDASTAYNTGLIHIAPDGTRTTGSSAQGKTSGTLYWKVPGSISGTYKYRCTNHSGMIGDIIIDDPSADLDSAAVIGLIDSDYVQLRQDYAYASLTGSPNVLDSADVSTIAGSLSGLDAAGVTALVDSDYVQLRQDYAYGSLTGTPNVLDSADVSLIAGSSAGVDSATVLGLIDSAHVQLRQDYAYASLTDAPNVLDSADVSTIAGSLSGLDAAAVTALVDSDYVQLRQDYAYGSLTGVPNVLDSADVSAIAGSSAGVDSATVLGLIDSAHVQLRQDYAYGSLTGTPNVLDSADVSLIAGGLSGVDSAYVTTQIDALIDGAPGALNTLNELAAAINDDSQAYNTLLSLVNGKLDSADAITLITTTVDSAYVQLRQSIVGSGGVDSATVLGLIDSAHVQLRQDYAYASLTGAPNVLDSALSIQLIDAKIQVLDIADIVGSSGNSGEFLKSLGSGDAEWANVLDSADVALIAGDAGTDSATVLGLIDSAHVQLRQDYAYASLTGSPNVLDSADVSLIAGEAGLDSALSIQLIDAKIQVLDIADIVGSSGNSGQYLKSLGSGDAEWANVLDSADVSLIAGSSAGVDSATVLGLIDSAHVQLRQDYAYASLTGVPNVLDSADVSLIAGDAGVDSATVLGLIDSAHVQLRQDYAYASLTGAPNILDSALTTSIITTTVDSAYVASRVSTNVATLNIAPSAKYARLSLTSQQSLPSSSTTVVTNFNTRVTDNTTNNLLTSTLGDGKFIIPAGVSKVKLKASLETASASDQIILQIQKNGSNLPGSTNFDIQSTGGDYVAGFTAILDVVENDYFQIAVFTASSATAEVDVNYSWFELEVIEGSILNQTVSTTIELEDLANVDSSSATQGQVLTWDSANSYWYASTLAAGTDSSSVVSIITTTVDSAYVQLRQDYAYASLTGVPNVLDSADVSLIAGGSGGGLDSSLSISLINTTVDSAYVQSKITSSTIYTRTITTATAGQTVFAATYTPNYVDVYVNGIKILNTTDFTATNGTSVTLLSSSDAGDIVEITAWVPTAIVGSVSAWVSVDSALTLYSGQRALADTTSSPVTLTLPSSPNLGDEVRVIDATNNAATNNITVARNGSKIMGLDSDLTININEAAFGLVYFNASRGWLLTEK